MSEHRAGILRHGLIGICAFAALVLLAVFYSTVSGAVERASRQRLAAAESSPRVPALAQRAAVRSRALFARVDN